MSLPSDSLSRPTPTRLLCHGGRWVLELSRLEAVERDVFQPRTERLEGTDSILAVLRRNEEGQLLASGAAQLMRTGRSEEDRAFEVSDGDWVPTAAGPAPSQALRTQSDQAQDASRLLSELRAELLVLQASHLRLRERVASLEGQRSGVPPANLRPARGSRGRRRSEPPPPPPPASPEGAKEVAGFSATQASPGLAVPASSTPREAPAEAPAVSPAPASQSGPQTMEELAQAVAGGARPLPQPELAGLAALAECLSTLMDAAPALESRSTPFELAQLTRPQGCRLLDDEGRERGAIIADLRATVRLGAALLGLPKEEAEQQIADALPSEDALLAMSEVFNNLVSPLSALPGNPKLRATALASLDLGTLPKLRGRLDLTVEGGAIVFGMF